MPLERRYVNIVSQVRSAPSACTRTRKEDGKKTHLVSRADVHGGRHWSVLSAVKSASTTRKEGVGKTQEIELMIAEVSRECSDREDSHNEVSKTSKGAR